MKTIAIIISILALVGVLGFMEFQIVNYKSLIDKQLTTKLEDVPYKISETQSIPLTQVVNALMNLEMQREKAYQANSTST